MAKHDKYEYRDMYCETNIGNTRDKNYGPNMINTNLVICTARQI